MLQELEMLLNRWEMSIKFSLNALKYAIKFSS